MKARLSGPEPKSKTSIVIALAAHVVLVLGLAAITFHVPLIGLFNRPTPTPEQTLRFIRVAPEPNPARGATTRSRSTSPAMASARAVLAPRSIPAGIPRPAAPTVAPGVVVGANPTRRDSSMAIGVQPGIPDPRLAINPMDAGHLPMTDAQKAEAALSAIYDQYIDSVRASLANRGRAPGDWSWGGKDGDKWGWDQRGIHLGGITIPNAVLAALPLNIGPSGRNMNALTDSRTDAYIRSDIQAHANIMSEDDFRSAINKVRARIDRERQERMAKQRKDPPKDPPE